MKKTIAIAAIGIPTLVALVGWVTNIQAVVQSSQPAAALAQESGDCIELYRNGVLLFADGCDPTPAPTDTPIPPTPAPSDTPPATFTAAPTLTPPPTATATLAPTVAPTATPEPLGHDTTVWHPPMDGHHHGFDIRESKLYTTFVPFAGQEIGYLWLSSPTENLYPFPAGKHSGFHFLSEQDLDCEQFNTSGNPNCIRSYLIEVHSLGDVHAIHTRVHSQGGAFEICTPDGSQCGFLFTGGHGDFGVLHNQYKTDICKLASDPPGYPYLTTQGLNQPPYRTGHSTTLSLPRGDKNPQFWSHLGPNEIMAQYYPHAPNNILKLAWTGVDAWAYINGGFLLCADPTEAVYPCPDGSCDFNHTQFQVWSITLENLPDERPFRGFTDVNGHIDETCTVVGPTCVPLFISETVPLGAAVLNRPVMQGNCDNAPCQEFDDGTPLHAPGYQP